MVISREEPNYALRAARALEELIPAANRDKAIAQVFNCSVRMAQYLRQGEKWTIERLNQARAVFGAEFDRRLCALDQIVPTPDDINARLSRIEILVADLLRQQGGGDAGR
jgi:hypothetical protein